MRRSISKLDEDAKVEEASRAKRLFSQELRRYPNVTGVGVGHRIKGGVVQPEICIRVYVDRKLPLDRLGPDEVIPRTVGGVDVDVIEDRFTVQTALTLQQRREFQLQLQAGISVGGVRVTAGTLGTLVSDATGRDLLLSNWHVLCGSDLARAGEIILQPGPFDGGVVQQGMARLLRFALTDHLDAACAELTGHRFCTHDHAGIGRRPHGTRAPSLGLAVIKSGRTTGVTRGFIADVDADVQVGGYPGGTLTFRNQIVVESNDPPFSAPGDSGSVVLEDWGAAVGLLFAGSSSRTILNPIDDVVRALGLDFGVHPLPEERDCIDQSI